MTSPCPLSPLECKQLIFALGVYVPLPKRAMQLLTEETMLLPSSEDFSLLVTRLLNMSDHDPKSGTDQARAILFPPDVVRPTPPAAAPHPAPIAPRDRWARDRKGNELPHPAGCEVADVHLWKTEQMKDGKYLRVTWQNSGKGHGSANCFDNKLWPWLINSQGKTIRLYLTRKGNYTNVVGVCA